jgi:hypothetical protein
MKIITDNREFPKMKKLRPFSTPLMWRGDGEVLW